MVFAPTGLQFPDGVVSGNNDLPVKFGSQHIMIRIRRRITEATGQSMVVVRGDTVEKY